MLRISFAGLILLFNTLLFTQGIAQCLSPEAVTTAIKIRQPTLPVTRLVHAEASAFMTTFNALPPVSNHQADTVLVVSEPGKRTHLILAFQGGCLVGRTVVSQLHFEMIMDRVAGSGA